MISRSGCAYKSIVEMIEELKMQRAELVASRHMRDEEFAARVPKSRRGEERPPGRRECPAAGEERVSCRRGGERALPLGRRERGGESPAENADSLSRLATNELLLERGNGV